MEDYAWSNKLGHCLSSGLQTQLQRKDSILQGGARDEGTQGDRLRAAGRTSALFCLYNPLILQMSRLWSRKLDCVFDHSVPCWQWEASTSVH